MRKSSKSSGGRTRYSGSHFGRDLCHCGAEGKGSANLQKAHQMCQEAGMDYWLARTMKALEKLKAQ